MKTISGIEFRDRLLMKMYPRQLIAVDAPEMKQYPYWVTTRNLAKGEFADMFSWVELHVEYGKWEWYSSDFYFTNEADRTAFLLRWG